MKYLILVSLIPILWLSKTCLALLSNYRRARQTGFPVVVCPINPLSPVWMLTHRHLIPLIEKLPSSWSQWTRYSYVGWAFDDRGKAQVTSRDAFILVNPGKNELFLSEAGTIDTVLTSNKEYPKPTAIYKALEVFGPNVDTIEGNDWKRHRKITNASFNERTHAQVWSEALTQAQQMLSIYLETTRGVTSTHRDSTVVALHVLTRALFGGTSHPFTNELEIQAEDGHTMSYRDALGVILKNVVHAVATPHWLLSFSFLPKRFRVLGQAIHAFNTYVTEMITKERAQISKRDPGANNMISSLIRASEEAQNDPGDGPGRRGLADDEILGNVFMFSFAGHETTANAMAYCILLMAAYPEYQEWLSEEINEVFGDRDDVETWEYEEAFPKLKRCLATMVCAPPTLSFLREVGADHNTQKFETLRLYGGISEIPKTTAAGSTHLTIHNKTYEIPPETIIWCNIATVQTQTRYWGDDPLVWRPMRWVLPQSPPPHKPSVQATLSTETIFEPTKGSFVPWSAGARVCPGQKFARVEFVAVMAALFKKARVRPVFLDGETMEDARRRILRTVGDSRVVVTLQMMRPEGVGVVWTRK